MKFGLFMMPLHHPTENPTLAFQRDLQLIEYVEDLGFEEIWVGEHHTGGWETIPSPDIFISAAAQRTKRIRIGTGVVSLPFQHPFVVAERMAFLDHLTYGRIMLGVGPGVLPSDAKLFGLEAAQLRPMLNEALEIILKLYQEPGPVTYEGEYWTLREMALQLRPYQKPHLPLAVASAGGSNSLELAGKYGLLILSALFSVGQTSRRPSPGVGEGRRICEGERADGQTRGLASGKLRVRGRHNPGRARGRPARLQPRGGGVPCPYGVPLAWADMDGGGSRPRGETDQEPRRGDRRLRRPPVGLA